MFKLLPLISLLFSVVTGEEGPQAFVRSAVESNPYPREDINFRQNYKSVLSSTTFEENNVPLRSAVEQVPVVPISYRVPIRDAVEFRSIDESQELRTERRSRQIWYENPFAAYVRTTSLYRLDSVPPYRANAYQVLVNPGQIFTEVRADIPASVEEYDPYGNIGNGDELSALKTKGMGTDKKYVVCHLTNWAYHRNGDGKFVPENLDSKLCTHIVYSFATLDPQTFLMKEFDPWTDIDNSKYIMKVFSV